MQRVAAILFILFLAGCQSTTTSTREQAAEPEPTLPVLSGAALQSFIAGKALRYSHYGAVSTFFADGRYGYRDYEVRDGGTWSIAADAVCITFNDGGRRCDRYALIGSNHFRIEEGGRQTKIESFGPA